MEDMLIARVKTYMQVRWTRGRQLCYQDHIVNFRQDVKEIAERFPRLPDTIDIVIIRKEDVDLTRHVDFIVRREKIKAALQYKIAHDPNYSDLIIDNDVLQELPENGSVANRIPSCRDNRQDELPLPAGPGSAATGGEPDDEDDLRVGGVVDVADQERSEVEHLRRGAQEAVRQTRYEQSVVSYGRAYSWSIFIFRR
jgi:hypothetical protein